MRRGPCLFRFDAGLGGDDFFGLERFEIFPRQLQHLFGHHVSDDHDHRVVRRVPAFIPALQILESHVLEIIHPADGRIAVGTGGESGGAELLVGERGGLVLGAQTPFLHHHLEFLVIFLLLQQQVAHAIGFQFEAHRKPVFLQALVIGGVILTGKGVLLPAVFGDDAGEFARGMVFRALEHHVLQHVRQPGDAVMLVAGADLVPHLGNHHRGAMVFLHDQLETVFQLVFMHRPCRQQGMRTGQQHGRQGKSHSRSPVFRLLTLTGREW